jgi:hypothetical protein
MTAAGSRANLKFAGPDSQSPLCRPSTRNGCWLMPVSRARENLADAEVSIGREENCYFGVGSQRSGCHYTAGMGALRHFLIVVVIGVVFRWLWKSSLNEHAEVQAGRTVFPPTRAIRILAVFFGLAFTSLFLWSWFAVRRPDEWWVPYLFLVFLVLSLCIYPPVLSIEVDGIGSRSWFGSEKKIRWEDVASLRYNTGNKQFTVCANDGRKITHAGFNAEPFMFQSEIQKRTRLPMKLTRPGTWKTETIEVPYEEVEIAE